MVIKVNTCPLTITAIYFNHKGTFEDQIILEEINFKTTLKINPGVMVSEKKWWPSIPNSSLLSTGPCKAEFGYGPGEWLYD